jgi:hypothetical protein
MAVKFKVSKKYVRGEKKGKRMMDEVSLPSHDAIHGYLWDITDNFDRKRCNYIVEWYKRK